MEMTLDFDACVGGCVERDCVCLHCFPLGGVRALGRVVAMWGDSLIVCDLVSKRQKPSNAVWTGTWGLLRKRVMRFELTTFTLAT